jgi:hypothetical protein
VRIVPLQAAGVALTLVAGVGLLALRSLDASSRPVSVDEAVERFRSAAPPTTASATTATATVTPTPSASGTQSATASRAPGVAPSSGPAASRTAAGSSAKPAVSYRAPAGVYTYLTTGYETADAGVSTARHDYPAETAMTVRHSACGADVRWDATEDRWDDVHLCVTGATSRATDYISFHRFFDQSQRHDYRCTGDSWFRPPVTRAGYRWTFDCTTADAKAHTLARVVGTERVTAAGRTFDALHIRYDTTLNGSSRGTNPQDFWVQADGPALLRQTSRVDADVDTPFGSIRYHEEYDLRLKSLTPRR